MRSKVKLIFFYLSAGSRKKKKVRETDNQFGLALHVFLTIMCDHLRENPPYGDSHAVDAMFVISTSGQYCRFLSSSYPETFL